MDRERTHWDGCWQERTHHDCALARIAALEAMLAVERERVNTAYTAMQTDYRELLINLDDERTRREAVLLNERKRREAAEAILRDAANCIEGHWLTLDIDVHFARYKD